MRGFAFLLESVLSLLAAIAVLAAVPLLPHATHKELRQYQLLSDVVIITAEKYDEEVNAFAAGNPADGQRLRSFYGKVVEEAGDYCLKLTAKGKRMEINCDNRPPPTRSIRETHAFYDGTEYWDAEFTLEQ